MLLSHLAPAVAWAAPPAPVIVAPTDGASVTVQRPTLSWQASAGASTYIAEYATSHNFAQSFVSSGSIADTSFTPATDLLNDTLYHWRVRASGSTGTSPNSVAKFWMPVTQVSPAVGATVSLTPVLDWADYNVGFRSASRTYTVQVSDDAGYDPARIIVNQTTTVSNYTLPSGTLEVGKTYYWRVRVTNDDGTSGWSAGRSFQSPPLPPGGATLISPSNGAALDGWYPTLTWNAVPTATSYRVHFIKSGGVEQISGDLTGTSFRPNLFYGGDATANNASYEWWIETRSSGGSSISGRWTFTTPPPTQPSAPILSTPANDTAVATLTPSFDWSDTTYTKNYRIQVGTGHTSTAITGQVAGPTVTDSSWSYLADMVSAFPLAYNTTYFWQVTAQSIGLNPRTASPIWSFRTPAPPGPVLSGPADGAVVSSRTPTLSWESASGASSYRVQVSSTGDFSGPLFVDTTVNASSGASYTLMTPVEYDATYSWRVTFTDSAGTSLWSSTRTFVGPARPAGPTPTSPANGAVVDSKTPTLIWDSIAAAATYTVQVSLTGDFSGPPLVDRTLPAADGTSYTLVTPLGYGSTAYWRVRFDNSTDSSQWSGVQSFQVTQPSGPDLTSPANGSTVDTRTPTLAWAPVAEAETYTVQVATDSAFSAPLVTAQTVDATVASSYTLSSPLTYSTTYYWRVSFANSVDSSGWSQVWSFAAPPPPIPTAPTPQTPGSASGGSIVGFRPSFDWSDATEATSYGFQLSRFPGFGTRVVDESGLTTSSFSLTADLEPDTIYYWRASATNVSGTSDWTTVFSFTTPPPPPVAPFLQEPANNATTTTTRPRFDWSDSNGATFYVFEIYSDAGLTSVVTSTTVTASEYDLATFLQAGATYFWRVRASSDISGIGPWSTARSFTTPALPPPGTMVLLTPDNGATIDTLTPTTDWQDDHTSTSYQFQLSTNAAFSSTVVNVTGASSTWTRESWAPLTRGTTYYWRVRGINSDGTNSVTGDWSETRSFVTPSVPAVPTQTSPATGTTVDSVQPTLTVGAVTGATTYTVQLSTANWFPNPVTATSSTTSLTPTTALAYSTQYYWRTSATNAAGTSAWSAARTLTTPAAPAPPDAPSLISPANGTIVSNARPTLDWGDVTGATKYRVEWTKSPTFAFTESARDNLTTSTFTLDVDLTFNKAYFWRVRATGVGGEGAWSAIGSFTTPDGPPAQPTLSLPADGATVGTGQPKLDWGDVTGASSYGVQVSTDSAFASTIVDSTVTASELTPSSPLAANATYFWRVKAINGVGDSGFTSARSFIVPAAPTGTPTLVSPADGATVTTLRPTLDWDDVADATSYEVQYGPSSDFSSGVTSGTPIVSTLTIPADLPLDADVFWRVRAISGGGSGPWSASRRLHTPATPTDPPAGPTLLQPTDNVTVTSIGPSFSWDPSARADGYRLQISTDQAFGTLAMDVPLTTTSTTLTPSLSYATRYYWRVQASNSFGSTSSAVRTFLTPAPPAAPAPTLLTPANGAQTDALAPTFDWADVSTATGYRIHISKSNTFPNPLVVNATTTTSEYARPSWQPLEKGVTYYWRVLATNSSGEGDWSEVRSFRIPAVPSVPTLTSPANATAVDTTTPTLTVGEVTGATGYAVQLSTANWFPNPITVTSSTTSLTPTTPLAYATTYYWRASANNAAGTSAWSAARTLTTPAAPAPPGAPTLVSPTGGSTVTNARPTLDWADVTGATKYRVEWTKSPTFAFTESARDNLTASTFTLDVDLVYATNYYWRVRATAAGGESPWSTIGSFVTPAGPPSAPSLLTPADGANADSRQPKLDWADAANATSYQVQVSTDSAFGTTLIDSTATVSEFTPTSPLATSTTYYWRIKAMNGVGDSGFTAARSFVVPAPPAAPTLVAPADTTTVTTLRPELDWGDVVGATSYEVQYSPSGTFAFSNTTATVTASTYTIPTNLPLNQDRFWRVRALNGGGTGPYSATWRFHTPATPPPATESPAAPTLQGPADATTIDSVLPTYTWDPADRANSYRVQISTDQTFTNGVDNHSVAGTSYTQATDLVYSTKYYWRVQALNNIGQTSSATRSFTTPPPPPPAAPTLATPADTATIDTLSPTFDWSDSPYATGYRLQVSTVSTFASTVVNTTATPSTFTMPAWQKLNASTTYYWRVQGFNQFGAGGWSSTLSFTTPAAAPPPQLPVAPTLTAPGEAVGVTAPTITSLLPPFDWAAQSDATGYRINLSKSSNFSTLVINSTTTTDSFSLAAWQGLTPNTQYWWRVQATNSVGTGPWSTVFTFMTPAQSSNPPAAPTLSSPANGATITAVRPALDWGDVASATGYQVQVSTSNTFASTVVDATPSASTFTPTSDLALGTYFWRVNASNANGTSAWSGTFSFTISSGVTVPAAPTLGSPANGATVTGQRPALDWGDVAGATGYQVQVSTSNTFGSTVIDTTPSASTFTPTSDLAPGTYFWRVNASNSAGTGPWSAVRNFVVPTPAAPVPDVPTLNSPGAAVGGSVPTLDTLRPAFAWSSESGATGYRIQIAKNAAFSSPTTNTTVTSNTFPAGSTDYTKGTQYWWRVQAINASGTSAWSTAFTFKIPAVPAAPALSSPGNGTTVSSVRPELDWNEVDGADRYQVQVSTSTSFGTKVVDVSVSSGTTYTLTTDLARNTTYYWRVTATNEAGTSPASTTRNFKTPN